MKWALTWNRHLEYLYELADDGDLPKPLEDEPALPPHLLRYIQCFWTLSASRSTGFSGGNAITITDMLALWNLSQCEPFEEFATLIHAMDAVFLDWQREQAEKNK